MRPPSYYNALASHTGYTSSSSTSYPRTSTSQELRSSIGSSSSSAYVTRTHLPFVSPSVLVAHCITGAGTSTRPYTQSSPSKSASSTLTRYGQSSSRLPSCKRAPSSYLSSASYTPRASASYLSSSGRSSANLSSSSSSSFRPALTSSSYYKPFRLRERPQLSQISSQLSDFSAATGHHQPSSSRIKPPASLTTSAQSKELKPVEDESWSSDVARNISRNKYLIKFREFDKPRASLVEPVQEKLVDSEEPVLVASVEALAETQEPEEMKLPSSRDDSWQPDSVVDDQSFKKQDTQTTGQLLWEAVADEPTRVQAKERRNIRPKIKNLRADAGKAAGGETGVEVKVKRVIKKKNALTGAVEKPLPSEQELKATLVDHHGDGQLNAKASDELMKVADEELETDAEKRIRFRQYNLDDFNFLTVLGHGGWGFVILAELKKHDAFFAVKCIKKITIVEDDDFDSIMIERKVLTLGNLHPFICKLFCTFESEGYLFFAMEYCAGGDLMFHVQREGKFDEPRCRFYAAEIICAIRFLHNRHIIYRDLKLDNILLDSRGHVRLVDFGMCQCRSYREELLPSNFCGTPEYISPEIIKGVPYNHSVDWWSFGVLLYEMAVGKMPFRGGDENELLWNVCYEQIHYPMFLSKELTKLLEQLLEREPEKRMGMASCKAGDIQNQAWFACLDWAAVEQLRIPVPFVPEVNSKQDVQNFDADFTSSTPELSPVDAHTLARIDQDQFRAFPYTNPNIFIFE